MFVKSFSAPTGSAACRTFSGVVYGRGRRASPLSAADARQVCDPPQARLFPHARLQRPLGALHQPEGGQLAAATARRGVHHRPLHLRAAQGGRLCPQGFLRETGQV